MPRENTEKGPSHPIRALDANSQQLQTVEKDH